MLVQCALRQTRKYIQSVMAVARVLTEVRSSRCMSTAANATAELLLLNKLSKGTLHQCRS